MSRHLVLVGGGHAHLTTLLNTAKLVSAGFKVSLVSPSRHHHYSGMGPGMLAGTYEPEHIRFDVKRMAETGGAVFIEASVARVDPTGRKLHLDNGQILPYDVCSMNAGSRVPWRGIDKSTPDVFPVKPLENLAAARKRVLDLLETGKKPRFTVAGGGPAGFEIACALARLGRDSGKGVEITVLADPGLLQGFPPRVRRLGAREMNRFGIRVEEGARLAAVNGGRAVLDDGREIPADCIFLAWGVEPPAFLRESGLLVDKAGALFVNSFLQCPEHPEIFGAGDCISFLPRPLAKVGVYAVRQNRVLYDNLLAALSGGPLSAFDPGGPYLLVFNLGDGRGLFFKRGFAATGKWAFVFKDYIDRRFIRRFGGGV